MNVLKHRILSDEDVMQVIKPTHLCDIGNQIPHCILLASIKWVKLFGLWSVCLFFFFFFFFFPPININWRGGYERPYYGLSYAIMKLRHINLKLLLSILLSKMIWQPSNKLWHSEIWVWNAETNPRMPYTCQLTYRMITQHIRGIKDKNIS